MKRIYLTVKMLNLIIFLLLFLISVSSSLGTSKRRSNMTKIGSVSILRHRTKLLENPVRDSRRLSHQSDRTEDDDSEEEALHYGSKLSSSSKTRKPALTYRTQSRTPSSSKTKISETKSQRLRDESREDEILLKKLIEKKKLQSSSSTTDLHRGLPVYDNLAHGTNHHMFNHGNLIHPSNHHSGKYPEYALDPASPLVLTHTQHNPLAPFQPLSPAQTQLAHPGLPAIQKKKRRKDVNTALLPLDKTLLYFGVAFGGLFWAIVAACFYNWGDRILPQQQRIEKSGQVAAGTAQRPIVVRVQPGKPPEYLLGRSLPGSSFSFDQILDMIQVAYEAYEQFDYQSLDCQKKTLCEMQQKQETFGETGRKIIDTFSFADGLPVMQKYLKEYNEAIQGAKNSTRDCAAVYSNCKYSVKEAIVKLNKGTNKP